MLGRWLLGCNNVYILNFRKENMKIRDIEKMVLGLNTSSAITSLCVRTKDGAVYLVKGQFIACVDEQGNFNGVYDGRPEALSRVLKDFKRFKVMKDFYGNEEKVFELREIRDMYNVEAHPTEESVVEIVNPKQSYFGRTLLKLANAVR